MFVGCNYCAKLSKANLNSSFKLRFRSYSYPQILPQAYHTIKMGCLAVNVKQVIWLFISISFTGFSAMTTDSANSVLSQLDRNIQSIGRMLSENEDYKSLATVASTTADGNQPDQPPFPAQVHRSTLERTSRFTAERLSHGEYMLLLTLVVSLVLLCSVFAAALIFFHLSFITVLKSFS